MLYEKELIERIEILRYELERLAIKEGIRSPQALEMSQNLDEAINNYYQFIMNKKLTKKAK